MTVRRPEGIRETGGSADRGRREGVTVTAGPGEEPAQVAFADIREALVLPPW